jgi:hypothetical protein
VTRNVFDEWRQWSCALRPRRTVAAALLAVAMTACAPASRVPGAEITSATPIADVFGPRFELVASETAIERFDPPGAGAGLGVRLATTVRNPNEFPITVERIEYRLLLRGQSVARAVLQPDLLLAPGASEPLSWRVSADLTDRRELWRPIVDAFAGTPLPFAIEGNVRFTSQSYAFTTGTRTLVSGDVLATQAVTPPRLRLEARESRVTVVRADAPVVSLALFATNDGDVGYFLSGRDLVLELNGEVVARIDLGPVPVPAGETGRTDLVFIVDRARLPRAAQEAVDAALAGERGDVRLRGSFAYDVLGVDSYAADIGDGLLASLPPSQLPRIARPEPAMPAAERVDDERADDEGADDERADDGGADEEPADDADSEDEEPAGERRPGEGVGDDGDDEGDPDASDRDDDLDGDDRHDDDEDEADPDAGD